MRWVLVPLLAACASTPGWNLDPVSDATLPALLGELRNPVGDASVVVGDRCYCVRDPAVRSEIRAFTNALADAIESRAAPPAPLPDVNWSRVVAVPWPSEAMSMTTMGVDLVRTDQGTVIYAWGLMEPNSWVLAEVPGTDTTAETWASLVAAVRAEATTYNCGPNLMLVGRGIDLRRIGGAGVRNESR